MALYNGPHLTRKDELEEPLIKQYFNRNSYAAFRRFVKQVDHVRTTERVLIAVDEFEYLEDAIDEGRLLASLLKLWHKLVQTYPWFAMIFAELHTLKEMTKEHWNRPHGLTVRRPRRCPSAPFGWHPLRSPTQL